MSKLNFIGENAESDAAKANTNFLFDKQILKFDLATQSFFWDGEIVNVEFSCKNN